MGAFFLGAVKVILSVCILPYLYTLVVMFYKYFGHYPMSYQAYFWAGVIGFLLSFIFMYSLVKMYEFEKKLVGSIFKFLAPFDGIFSYVLPLYLLFVLILFYSSNAFFHSDQYNTGFMLLTGFFFCQHIVLAAQDLKEQESPVMRFSYLFMMGVIFIINVFLLVYLLDIILDRALFGQFFKDTISDSHGAYKIFFRKIMFFR